MNDIWEKIGHDHKKHTLETRTHGYIYIPHSLWYQGSPNEPQIDNESVGTRTNYQQEIENKMIHMIDSEV